MKEKDEDIHVAANKIDDTILDRPSEITNGFGLLMNGNEIDITRLPRIDGKILAKFHKQSISRINHPQLIIYALYNFNS